MHKAGTYGRDGVERRNKNGREAVFCICLENAVMPPHGRAFAASPAVVPLPPRRSTRSRRGRRTVLALGGDVAPSGGLTSKSNSGPQDERSTGKPTDVVTVHCPWARDTGGPGSSWADLMEEDDDPARPRRVLTPPPPARWCCEPPKMAASPLGPEAPPGHFWEDQPEPRLPSEALLTFWAARMYGRFSKHGFPRTSRTTACPRRPGRRQRLRERRPRTSLIACCANSPSLASRLVFVRRGGEEGVVGFLENRCMSVLSLRRRPAGEVWVHVRTQSNYLGAVIAAHPPPPPDAPPLLVNNWCAPSAEASPYRVLYGLHNPAAHGTVLTAEAVIPHFAWAPRLAVEPAALRRAL